MSAARSCVSALVAAVLASPLAAQLVVADGPEFRVNVTTTGDQSNPAVAKAPNGDFVVAWRGQGGSAGDIFARRFASSGAALGGELQIAEHTTNEQAAADLAIAADGSFVVVWRSVGADPSFGVSARRFSSSGAPLTPELVVNSYTTNAQERPAVAATADGDFVVVWDSFVQDGDLHAVVGRRFASDGTPAGGDFIVNTYTTSAQASPDVGVAANGDFLVGWQSSGQDGSSEGVRGRKYGSNGTPFAEFALNTYTTGLQRSIALAMAPDEDFVAVWESAGEDGSGPGIVGRRSAFGGTILGSPFPVNATTVGNQVFPAVAIGPDSSFVAVWEDQNLGELIARRFDSAGDPLGDELRVPSSTGTSHRLPPSPSMRTAISSSPGRALASAATPTRVSTRGASASRTSSSPTASRATTSRRGTARSPAAPTCS